MDPILSTLVAVCASVAGLFVGAWAKRRSYMIIPFNDPLSWLLLMSVFLILLLPDLAPQYAFIDPYDPVHDIILAGFFLMYIYGYVKEEMLYEYASSHNIFQLQQIIQPVVYYWNDQNQLCWQPQRMRYVLKRMLFNVDCPLDFPVNDISRRRYVEFQGKFLKLSAYVVDTSAFKPKEEYVTKWVIRGHEIRFKVLSLVFEPSPMNTYDAYDFYTEGKIADEYVQNYQRLKVENANASADIRMARVLGAVKIVESITSMTPDAVVMGRVIGDLEARNGDTGEGVRKASKVGSEGDKSANRRKRAAERHQQGASE